MPRATRVRRDRVCFVHSEGLGSERVEHRKTKGQFGLVLLVDWQSLCNISPMLCIVSILRKVRFVCFTSYSPARKQCVVSISVNTRVDIAGAGRQRVVPKIGTRTYRLSSCDYLDVYAVDDRPRGTRAVMRQSD